MLGDDFLKKVLITGGSGDIAQAMQPLFTTRPEGERSGMGFSFMEAFMEEIIVESEPQKGTKVKMWKEIGVKGHQFE